MKLYLTVIFASKA